MNEQFALYRKLGSTLIQKGKWFLNKAIPVKKTVFSYVTVRGRVEDITGCKTINLYDKGYATTDIDTWKTIIKYEWSNKRKWIEDTWDCDNFAGAFSSHCADVYGLNTAGRFTVELVDPKTGRHIGYHRACIILTDKLDCYLLETQTDKMIQLKKGVHPVIDNWGYRANYISFN